MSVPCSTSFMSVDPRLYCETMNELHSYITSSKRGYLTQAELFRYYRQRHENTEIPYRLLGYRSLLDLLSSDQRLFSLDLRREPAYVYSTFKIKQERRERQQGATSLTRHHHSTNTLDERNASPARGHFLFDLKCPFDDDQDHDVLPQTNEPTSRSDQQRSQPDQFDEPEELFQEASPNLADRNSSEPTGHDQQIELHRRGQTSKSSIDDQNQKQKQNPGPAGKAAVDRHSFDFDGSSRVDSGLNRSKSTSTTSLYKPSQVKFVDLYLFLSGITLSFIFLGLVFYKLC